ncbi:MAG: tripartite tricarboxylate transporter substrate binding protein [Betaproteobacteria bacterium]|nr:tripartite tricarboxylate transporter substrate binding protein [Betaproteobacteria bacterium]
MKFKSCFVLAVTFAAATAQAQLPGRPVQIVVPNAPGGGPDLIARLIAPKLSETIRQSVVVDNRSSNNGIVGAEFGARGAPDGSVITVGNAGTHAINATLYKKLPYDPLRDFIAVSEVANAPMAVVTSGKLPASTLREFIAEAKKAQGRFNIAVAGATGEIAGNALKMMAQVDMGNVNYKGGVPAVTAVIANEAQMTLTNYTAVATQVEAGRLKLLAVTSAQRAAQIPNVPTVAESGLEGYDFNLWYGLFVPAKTPQATVQALYREAARIVALPEVRERLVATGHEVVASTPEQFGEKVRRDAEKYRKIILESNMQQD